MANTITLPAAVAERFADTWCGQLTQEVAPGLNCAEVEALAEILRALGAEQAANEWVQEHAVEDEPGDEHFENPVSDAVSLATDGYRCMPEDLPEGATR
ncbi:hypothetical protein ACFVP3_23485 [Streptomyces sp. NPDC057806]|uniref:hypothetical protein n=1 Tax=Streptomyces sp. NPDC057806 TaxID=3346255 RepID=UPI0036AAEB69